jgi:hypothetical protein
MNGGNLEVGGLVIYRAYHHVCLEIYEESHEEHKSGYRHRFELAPLK